MATRLWENPVYTREMRAWRRLPVARRLRQIYGSTVLIIAIATTCAG